MVYARRNLCSDDFSKCSSLYKQGVSFSKSLGGAPASTLPSIKVSSNTFNQPQNPIVNYIEHYRNLYASPENFIKRRVDYGRMKVFDEKYRKELERRKSFTNFPRDLNHLIIPLAKSGFYYIGVSGKLLLQMINL